MFFKLAISLGCLVLLLGVARDSNSGAVQNPVQGNASQTAAASMIKPTEFKSAAKSEAGTVSSAASLDACALIEKSEIASMQGVEVRQMQPTSQQHGGLDISQCYYTVISADGSKNLSVYVQVIRPNPQSAQRDALKKFWKERFRRESKEKTEEEKEKREEHEEEEEINPPLSISGVGDEAFWLGTSRGGALYVLKKDKVLRVTVGGADDAKAQLEKSKTLAKKALARLM